MTTSMRLRFQLPRGATLEPVHAAFELVASALLGHPAHLECVSKESRPDQNGAFPLPTFHATWRSADGLATLTENVASGEGNPRDGYGYALELRLSADLSDGPATCTARGGGWEPRLDALDLVLQGLPPASWRSLREALAARLGPDADGSAAPDLALANLRALVDAGLDAEAETVAREALARGTSSDIGYGELISWVGQREGGAAGLARRLREAPGDVAAWEEALAAPPPGFTTASLTTTLRRLLPHEPARQPLGQAPWFAHPEWCLPVDAHGEQPAGTWRRLDSGQGPGASWPAVPEHVTATLTGFHAGTDWQNTEAEVLGEGDARASLTRRARWDAAGVLQVRADVHVAVRPARDWRRPLRELMKRQPPLAVAWTFVAGPEAGDVLVLAEKTVVRERQTVPLGTAVLVQGTPAFQARAEAALRAATPFRWVPCAPDACFPEEPLTPEPWLETARAQGPLALAQAVCAHAGLSADDAALAARALASCRCEQAIGYCPHRREVLDRSRALGRATTTTQRESSAAWAQQQALETAFEAMGAQPDAAAVERCAQTTASTLRILAAMR